MSYNKETQMYEGFIYLITNTINDNVYVGQTIQTVQKRWRKHISDSNKRHYTIYKAIQKYGKDKFSIQELEKVESDSRAKLKEILNDKEIYYIALYNSFYHGYNDTLGGNSGDHLGIAVDAYDLNGILVGEYKSSVEASEKLGVHPTAIQHCYKGEANTAMGYVFRIHGESFDKYDIHYKGSNNVYKFNSDKELIKIYYYGYTQTAKEEGCDLSSIQTAIRTGRPYNGFYWNIINEFPTEIKSKRGTEVERYDLDWNYIDTFDTATQAAELLGTSKTQVGMILLACKQPQRTAFGFHWKCSADYKSNKNIKINKYDLDDNFIDTFDKAISAARSVGKDKVTAITKVCNKNGQTAYGFKWFYADDPDQPDKSKIITSN